VFVHAILLGAAASLPASHDTVPNTPPPPPYEGDSVLVVLHPGLDTLWSPPPPLLACFEPSEIDAARAGLSSGFMHLKGWADGLSELRTWADLGFSPTVVRGFDPRENIVLELFRECEGAAQASSHELRGQYSLRARPQRDGSPIVSIVPEHGVDLDERLRCCLEQTGKLVAADLGPHAELRYKGGPGGRGGTIYPRAIR
jgi:hypothetical protein